MTIEERMQKRRETRKALLIWVPILVLVVGIIVASYFLKMKIDRAYNELQVSKIIREVTIPEDTSVRLDMFLSEPIPENECDFITDVSQIDTSYPGSYQLRIKVVDETVDVVLNVKDMTPPTARAIPQETYTGVLPKAEQCLTDIYDKADVTVDWYSADPDVSTGGFRYIPAKLTDSYGNMSIVQVPFTVINDTNPPVILGTHNMEFFIGDYITYRDGVTVEDDHDRDPDLEIDTSAVDPDTDGTYPVRYIATDEYGNQCVVVVNITMRTMPEGYVEPEVVYAEAQEVLDQIIEPDMTDVEKAFRIFRWARNNIHYIGTSIKTDWTAGANEGFTTLRGDCYTYYACCKALLDVAGIENELVERYPVVRSQHFWNLVKLDGQWYHCDSCPSTSHEGFWFMRTDDELDYSHRFDPEAELPERATESVQSRLDFFNLTIRDPQ